MAAANTDKFIELTQGKTAIVSQEDYELVSQYKWSYDSHNNCAVRSIFLGRDKNGKQKSITVNMHRFVTGAEKGKDTDHINGNRLDNRRSNLRVCEHKDNQRNMKMHKDNTSGYKGVSKSRGGKWVVKVGNKYIATFSDVIDAAKRYNEEAISMYGKYAKLNVIGDK